MHVLTKTPFGSIQVGIRDNAVRVDYLGFKVPQSKAVIIILSSGFAGDVQDLEARPEIREKYLEV